MSQWCTRSCPSFELSSVPGHVPVSDTVVYPVVVQCLTVVTPGGGTVSDSGDTRSSTTVHHHHHHDVHLTTHYPRVPLHRSVLHPRWRHAVHRWVTVSCSGSPGFFWYQRNVRKHAHFVDPKKHRKSIKTLKIHVFLVFTTPLSDT